MFYFFFEKSNSYKFCQELYIRQASFEYKKVKVRSAKFEEERNPKHSKKVLQTSDRWQHSFDVRVGSKGDLDPWSFFEEQ